MYPNFINKPSFISNTGGTTFGASTSSFGQPPSNNPMFPSMQPSSIFQTPNTSSFNAGPSSQPTFGSNLFGQQQQPSTSGLFGGSNAFGPNKTSFGFGSPPAQTGLFAQQPQQQTGSSLFQSNPTTTLFGSNAFGSQGHTGTFIKFAAVTGTDTMQKSGVPQSISTKHHCITCMKEYENKSLEELRFEDYSANRKGPQQQTVFSNPPFGGSTAVTSSPLFGQTDNKQAFGTGQNFVSFSQSTPAFGVTNPTSTSSLFTKPSFGATTTNTNNFGFNSTPSTSNPFSPPTQAPKPLFSQSLFTTTQPQPTFGTPAFGQTNNQNNTSNIFPKPAQASTGFNTGQGGFTFNLQGTSQASSIFPVSKPNTGFGIFGQTNTGTTNFGQTTQPTFGNFGKLPTSAFAQPQQPFTTNLAGGLQQQPLFGNSTSKPSLFLNTTTNPIFSNNVFQQTPNSYSLNMNQQQTVQFPPEPSDESKNISLVATDSFPDGPHVYGLEPILNDINNSTTNPQDIKAMLDYSKKRDENSGTGDKIKVQLPKPKRGSNFSKEFFETNQALKSSHKYLIIRNFNEDSPTIYNKYKNELLEEAEECLRSSSETDSGSGSLLSARSVHENGDGDKINERDLSKLKKLGLKLQFDSTVSDETESNKSFSFDETSFAPLIVSSKPALVVSKLLRSNGNISIQEEETTIIENESDTPSSISLNGDNTDNSAGVTLTKTEYYMFPAVKDLQQYINDNGECVVQGLTIGRKGYGNVYFPDTIDISNMNFDEIVHFRHREVIVYPDDTKKPPVGEGLNRRAQVTLDKIFPREKGTNKYLTEVPEILKSSFVDNLMHVTQKHNCKFVDYRPKTGSWVFKVQHFSKYAFTDSDEEECEITADKAISSKTAQEMLKKIEEATDLTTFGLGGSKSTHSHISKETDSLLSEPILELWTDEEQYMLTEDLYHTESAIQTLKSSFFTNLVDMSRISETDRSEALIALPKQETASEVVTVPKVYNLPDGVSLGLLPDRIMNTQRCYIDLGIFRNNTYKVGFSKGFNFFRFDMFLDNDIVHALNQHSIPVESRNNYNNMMPDLSLILRNTLEESDFYFDNNNVPTLSVRQNFAYLRKQTELFNEHVNAKTLMGKDKYFSSIWNLCTALWGPGVESPWDRRQNLCDWLKKFSYELSDEWNFEHRVGMSESEIVKIIFKLLSFHKVAEACNFASKNNLSQLSMLISQLSANERFKHWMYKYVDCFSWKEKDVILDDFKKLYLILTGLPGHASINNFEGLDWMRCFGLYLWYIAPYGAPIDIAYKLYKQAFEVSKYATPPIPPYCDKPTATTEHDLLYHILTLYVDSTYQLSQVLHPETHTDNIMDYRLGWFLLQLFLSLKVGLIKQSEEEYLHTTFATQLESMGLWKWAIFVLLFLKNNAVKKNLVMRILERNLGAETDTVEKELVAIFKLPPYWIHEVKAIKAKMSSCHYEYFQHSLYMENWPQVNDVLINHIVPELFINEQYTDLTNIINKLEPVSNALAHWNIELGLFKELLELQDIIDENSVEVKFISGKLISLFRRINYFPLKNDKQKLCVAELSRKCAFLFKLIHKTLDSQNFQAQFMDVLGSLVMPPDMKHYEILQFISRSCNSN